jgi:aspartyl-tRNA(Asn)/glutamyl-tRNA(Gln) amidotransferase subunit A
MSVPIEIHRQPLYVIAEALRSRRLRATELLDACLADIRSQNPRLNAFIAVLDDSARQEATRADAELDAGRARGPLHGVPISLKDLIDVAGAATTAASHVRDGHRAAHDAPAVARLREAGAVIIGKTNLHEFAFGTTNEDSAFGPARNPHDPSRSPGGSSGGSAIAVATGMSVASIGTDTGGSIRIPAAACGVVGLKAALGDIPCEGVVPLSRTMDHVGPLARTVLDAALVYDALVDRAGETWSPARGPLRLGVPRPFYFDRLDRGIRARFDAACAALRAGGHAVADVEIELAAYVPAVYLHIVLAEAAAYHGATLESMPERYVAGVRTRLEMGRYVTGEDYVRAMRGRDAITSAVDRALNGLDALILPALAIPAPSLGEATVDVDGSAEPVRGITLRLTQTFNLSGHPAVSIPMGRTPEGLPAGLQMVGHPRATRDLLRAALACEAQIGPGAGSVGGGTG